MTILSDKLLKHHSESQIILGEPCIYCIKHPKILTPEEISVGDIGWDIENPMGMISPTGDIYLITRAYHDYILKRCFNVSKNDALKQGWLVISFNKNLVYLQYKDDFSSFRNNNDCKNTLIYGFNHNFLSQNMANILVDYIPPEMYSQFWYPEPKFR